MIEQNLNSITDQTKEEDFFVGTKSSLRIILGDFALRSYGGSCAKLLD
jgi:hypothetical protein